DVHVGVARVLADDLSFVDRLARRGKHDAAGLEMVDRVGGGAAGPVGDERAVLPVGDLPLPWSPPVEEAGQEPGAARVGQNLAPVPDEPARRDPVLEPDAPGPV